MSIELIKQLKQAAGESAEVVGGNVSAMVDGVKVRLGGPEGDSNTFSLTAEGRKVLDAARAAEAPKPVAAKPARQAKQAKEPEQPKAPEGQDAPQPAGDELPDL